MTLKNGNGIEAGRIILRAEKNFRLLVKGTNDVEKTLYDEFLTLLIIEKLPQILHTYKIGQDTGLATKQTHVEITTLTLKHGKSIKS